MLNPEIAEKGREVVANAKLRESWGSFLDEFEWSAFATLTFAQPQSTESAGRAFNRWIRRLEQRSGAGVDWFVATENSRAGMLHLHALCNADGALTPEEYREAWPFGRAHVDHYDRARGARYYLVKEMGTGRLVSYDISPALSRALPADVPIKA